MMSKKGLVHEVALKKYTSQVDKYLVTSGFWPRCAHPSFNLVNTPKGALRSPATSRNDAAPQAP
jgi:hypothetical protein